MNIYFRAFELEDAFHINKLRQDEEREKLIGGVKRFVSIEREKEWVKNIILKDDPSHVYLAICDQDSGNFIGYTSITEIDFRIGSCFWSGIKIFPEFSSRGIGKLTALKVLKYVFEELRMERCIATALEEHEVAINYLEGLGYKKEGLMRHHNYKDGEFKNTWLFSILKEEYFASKKRNN